MQRITCVEADRLARDLRRAEEYIRQAAHFHADQHAAMRILGNRTMTDYHQFAHQDAAATANELANYAERLSDRKPLWDTGTGPQDQPRPAKRLPGPPVRIVGGRR